MATAVDSSNNGRHTRLERLEELLSVDVDDEIVHDVVEKIKERRHRARQMASRRLGSKKSSSEDLLLRADVHTEQVIEITEAKEKTRPQVTVERQMPSSFPGSQTTPSSQTPAKSNTPTAATSKVSAGTSIPDQTEPRSESHRPAQSSTYRMRRFQKAFNRHWQARRKDPKLRSQATAAGAPDAKDSQSAQVDVHREASAPTTQIDGHRKVSAPTKQIDVQRQASGPTSAPFEICESYSEDAIVAGTSPVQATNRHKDGKDDASVSNETHDSDQTRVPKHLRGLFSSNVLASKPKANSTSEPQPFAPQQELVSDLIENYLCSCAAAPFDEDEVGLDDVKAPASIEVPDHGVKHFLETRAEQFSEITLKDSANHQVNVTGKVDTVARQTSPTLESEPKAIFSSPTEGQISPERAIQKTDGDTQLNADSCSSSNLQDFENSSSVEMSQVSAIVSVECEGLSDQGVQIESPMNASSALQSRPVHLEAISSSASAGVRSSVDGSRIAESATIVAKGEGTRRADSVEYQATPVKKGTTPTTRNRISLIPTLSLSTVREKRPQPALAKVLPSQEREPSDAAQRQQTLISAMSPLRAPSQVNGSFHLLHTQSTDNLRAQCSPTSVRATNFWPDAVDRPPAIPQEVFMPVDSSKSISDECKNLGFDLPLRSSIAAFADYFNFKAIAWSPSKVDPSNLACCFTTPEVETETSRYSIGQSFDLFDDDVPSLDDDGPSLDGGVPSLDGVVPSLDDDGPSFEYGAPSLEDGQSDDGLSLDDGQHYQDDWADSMNNSVDRVVEALDATTSGFFATTTDIGNTWLGKSVRTGFGTSKHGTVDDVLEDVCEKLDDIEVTMFISSFWNTKRDTNVDLDTDREMEAGLESHEKRLVSVASF